MRGEADRGAADRVTFQVCTRGFLLTTGDRFDGLMGRLYAFDSIEDVGKWFVDQYGPMPWDDEDKAAPETEA